MASGAYLLDAGLLPYREALELQQSLAAAVSQRAIPETVVLVEHPPVVTTGRRTDAAELHLPVGVDVDVVETNRGGKSTFHGPGQLVCYPILDLNRHGKDLKRYVRELETAIIGTVAPFGLEAMTIEGLTGVWLEPTAPEARVDRRPRLAVGDDPRVRAERRSRYRPPSARGSRPVGSKMPGSRP